MSSNGSTEHERSYHDKMEAMMCMIIKIPHPAEALPCMSAKQRMENTLEENHHVSKSKTTLMNIEALLTTTNKS